MFNECITLLFCNLLHTFFLFNPDVQDVFGWILCGVIGVYLILHIGLNGIVLVKEWIKKLKACWQKCNKCCEKKATSAEEETPDDAAIEPSVDQEAPGFDDCMHDNHLVEAKTKTNQDNLLNKVFRGKTKKKQTVRESGHYTYAN